MTQPTTGRLDLSIWRNDDVYEFPLQIVGPDLTGVALRAQLRLGPDVPGPALSALGQVTNGNAEGVRLASVTKVGDVYQNDVRIRINKSTRQALPYGGEIGDAALLGWAMMIGGVTRLQGEVRVLAHVMDSDAAPANRPMGYGYAAARGGSPQPSASLTISKDGGATLVIGGADIAIAANDRAQEAMTAAQLAAATAQAAGRYYPTRAAGEAASAVNQYFSTDDAGVLVSYRRAAGGSVEIARSLTPALLEQPDGASRVGFAQGAPFVQTRRALDKLREMGASAIDAGAVGDGVADDTDAVQQMLDYFAARGGAWNLPAGKYRLTRGLVWDTQRPQRVTGVGQRPVYPGAFDLAATSGLAVLLADHLDRSAIRFVGSAHGHGNLTLRDLALTARPNRRPQAAFAIDVGQWFLRNFRLRSVSINDFVSAFDLYNTGGVNNQAGLLSVRDCNIHRNDWIARTLAGTQWNGFSFCNNEAGQNGYLPGQGGISVMAHNAEVVGNCFEGMHNAVHLYNGTRGSTVRDNYFEANVGKFAVQIEGSRGPYEVGPNTFLAIDSIALSHLVLITNSGPGLVNGPFWGDGVYKTNMPVLGNSSAGADNILNPNVSTIGTGLLRMDGFDSGLTFSREPEYLAIRKQRVTTDARELTPWSGMPMPVQEMTTTQGAAAVMFEYNISAANEQWVVVSWLFKQEPGAGAGDPYVSLSVNGTGAAGSKDYVASAFNEYWRAGEWCLLTAAIRLGAAMTSLTVRVYPFGLTPAAGRKARMLRPLVYTTDSPSKIIPYIDDFTARSVTATPNVAGFERGDRLINANVAPGVPAGFVKYDGANDHWGYA